MSNQQEQYNVETVQQGISGFESVMSENSSHMPHLEKTERFLQVLGEFLNRVEDHTD